MSNTQKKRIKMFFVFLFFFSVLTPDKTNEKHEKSVEKLFLINFF